MRTLPTLDRLDAEAALAAMRDALLAAGKAAVVAVADAHGDPIALLRLDGAPASSVTIACNKAWTAAREGIATRSIGTRVRSERDGFDIAYYGDARYVGWGGGLPVRAGSAVVGAVAVSGLPEDDDEQFAAVGLRVLEARIAAGG